MPTNTPSIEEIVMSEGYHDGIDKGKKVGPGEIGAKSSVKRREYSSG